MIRADVGRQDPVGFITVKFKPSTKTAVSPITPTLPSAPPEKLWGDKIPVLAVDYTKLKPEQLIERATGHGDDNLWLSWLI